MLSTCSVVVGAELTPAAFVATKARLIGPFGWSAVFTDVMKPPSQH